jgi:hypothetical protein
MTMLLPAIASYCFGWAVPARDPEPAQGTNAKQRETAASGAAPGAVSGAVLAAFCRLAMGGGFTVRQS